MQINFVRRIDELGRIVIPKEIRGKMRIESGELLDLNISDDSLIIRKASGYLNLEYAKSLVSLIECLSDIDIIITEGDKIRAFSKNIDKSLEGKEITEDLKYLLKERLSKDYLDGVMITQDYKLKGQIHIKTLIKDSDVLGLIILKENDNCQNIDLLSKSIINLLVM